jgi:hypothetical protein
MRVPNLTVATRWRDIYSEGAFAQRELASESSLRSASKDRGIYLGIGHSKLEELDAAGGFRPIGFALEGYSSGFAVPADNPTKLRFVDEGERQPWSTYEWHHDEEREYANVSPLYSPWQLLYVDDLAHGADEAWRPAMKLLVALQNQYWPAITGRQRVVSDPQSDGWIAAGPDPAHLDPTDTLARFGTTPEELLELYYFLVERGLDRDPRDGLTLLRRARPRAFHTRWRGLPLRAQDCFDAAEVVRRVLLDVTGEQPKRPQRWPMDGRQDERSALYERGPGASWSPAEIKEQLLAAELYPHGVHVIGEGPSERIVVEWIVEALVGPRLLDDLAFHDLGGSGSAAHVEPLAQALRGYAVNCVLIVDREGQMADYLGTAIADGRLGANDVLLFDDSLEASNATSEEMVGIAHAIGRATAEGEPPIEFELTAAELDGYHEDRISRSPRQNPPGKADSLIVLVRRKTEQRLSIDKLDFVESLGRMIAEELIEADSEQLDAIKQRRPIVGFVIDRVIGPLNRPRPIGRSI